MPHGRSHQQRLRHGFSGLARKSGGAIARQEVSEQRRRIKRALKQMPSLANLIDEYLVDVYNDAVSGAAAETGLPKATFPRTNPYTRQQIFDPDYLP